MAGIGYDRHLLVWNVEAQKLVGRVALPSPIGPGGMNFSLLELGFAPDESEFAALFSHPAAEKPSTLLLNWNLKTGLLTDYVVLDRHYGTLTIHRKNVYNDHEFRLRFLDDHQGWLLFHGKLMVKRQTGEMVRLCPPTQKFGFLGWPGRRLMGSRTDPRTGVRTVGTHQIP